MVIGLLSGAFGMAYFMYGKKQQMFVPMITGFALCIYPYFTDNLVLQCVIGILLLIVPFVVRY